MKKINPRQLARRQAAKSNLSDLRDSRFSLTEVTTDENYTVSTHQEDVFAFSQFFVSCPPLKKMGSERNRDIGEELLDWLA